MTARTKARTCTAAALLFATASLTAGMWHPALAIPGTAGALILWLVARTYRAEHRELLFRCEQARRAGIAIPDPRPTPDWEQLAEQARYDDAFDKITRHWNEDAA